MSTQVINQIGWFTGEQVTRQQKDMSIFTMNSFDLSLDSPSGCFIVIKRIRKDIHCNVYPLQRRILYHEFKNKQ